VEEEDGVRFFAPVLRDCCYVAAMPIPPNHTPSAAVGGVRIEVPDAGGGPTLVDWLMQASVAGPDQA
jgi:hypothetical protein